MRKREMSFVYDADKMAEVHDDKYNVTLWIKAEEALKSVDIEVLSSSDRPYLEKDDSAFVLGKDIILNEDYTDKR